MFGRLFMLFLVYTLTWCLQMGLRANFLSLRSLVVLNSVFLLVLFSGASFAQERVTIVPAITLLLLDSDNNDTDVIDTGLSKPESPADAARFLTQATFGPTYSDILALTGGSYEAWLEQQFNTPQTYMEAYSRSQHWVGSNNVSISGSTRSAILNVMLEADDQLRQRVAYALSQIFVVSRDFNDGITERPFYFLHYYDLLGEHAFANYRDLIEAVSRNAVMGSYLSFKLNAKAGSVLGPFNRRYTVMTPDENYAREILQLFSIGLIQLNLDGTPKRDALGNTIPTYTQATVENFARVFTGWNIDFSGVNRFEFNNLGVPPDTKPMNSWNEFHDVAAKVLLNGVQIPAGRTVEQDLQSALDNIFSHPNVGPFISSLLIQHLVTSNPTPAYVERVATVFNNNGEGVRGDLKAVIRAILLDVEARDGHKTLPETFGKIKAPFVRQVALWRGLEATRRTSNDFLWGAYHFGFWARYRQFPLEAPSVFNFFQPDFSPPGPLSERGLVAPEGQLIDFESAIGIASVYEEYLQRWHLDSGNSFASSSTALLIDYNKLTPLVPDDLINPVELVERLNLVFLGGSMSDQMKTVLLQMHSTPAYRPSDKLDVVEDLVSMVIQSPQFWVQK